MTKNTLFSTPTINKLSDILIPNISEVILNIYDVYHKLADIFINHLGYIQYYKEENQFAYKKLLYHMLSTGKINDMQILGHCAEAVVVRRCNESPEINKKWLDIAHRWTKYNATICNETMAIGTGHYRTQIYYPNFYHYNDPQYDIIWINQENNEPLVNGFPFGSYIGLQIKTSINSENNINDDLRTNKYYVPIVYFDICNDYMKPYII